MHEEGNQVDRPRDGGLTAGDAAFLHAIDRRLRSTLDALDQVAVILDPSGRVIYANGLLEPTTGWRRDDAIGADWFDHFLPEEVRARVRAGFEAAVATGSFGPHLETEFATPDGHHRVMTWSRTLVADDEGRPEAIVAIGRDLTADRAHERARAEAERALRDNEARLRRLVEGIDGMVAFQETADDPLYLGVQVVWILGYEADAINSLADWQALVHPLDLPMCLEIWESGEPTWQLEYRMLRADGEWIWVEDRGRKVPAADGSKPGTFGVITDVTARHEADDRLREADARFRAVFEDNPDAIGVFRPVLEDGRFVDAEITAANRVMREQHLLRWSAAQLAGKWIFAVRPDLRPALFEPVRGVIETGRPYRGEHRTGPDVDLSVFDVSMFPFEDGFALVARDVTASALAEADAARLAAAIEQTSESVMVTDLAGHIVYVNPAFERVSGYTRDEVMGRNPNILSSGVQIPEVYAAMWAALGAGETWSGELVNRRKDGSLYLETASISPIRDAAGAVTGYVAVKRDVTDERELERQLRSAQRLEAIGQLAGGIAHDFNNLLTAIRGYGDFVGAAIPVGAVGRSDLDEMLRAVDRASTLTRQLLAFSRRKPVAPVDVLPSSVIDDLAPMLRRLLGTNVILSTVHLPGAGAVRMDPGQLEQVILNLAVNARDAMPAGGRLELRTAPFEPEAGGGRTWTRITASDTGSGMDEETRRRVFEPFFTTKEPDQGTGMGLSTVFGIVRQAGGRIGVESVQGTGSVFTIDLPPAPAAPFVPPERRPEVTIPAPGTRHGAVLLAEDDEPIRRMLVRILEGMGFTVHAAASGDAALALGVAERGLDLLVTDVLMPGMQGPELARRVRELCPGVPVLFVTAFAGDHRVDAGTDAGFHQLDKPFEAATFRRAVEAALDAPGPRQSA